MRSARACAASGSASAGRNTYTMSASEPMPSSRPPNRPMPITANSMPSGPSPRIAVTSAERWLSVTSESPWPSSSTVQTSRIADSASRSTSRRRMARNTFAAAAAVAVPAEHRALLVVEGGERSGPQLVDVLEPGDGLGSALEELAREPRAREHAREAQRGIRRVAEQPQVPVRRAERLAEPAEREQAVVGVGAVGEPRDQHRHQVPLDRRAPRDPGGERADVRERAARVAEADRREPSLGLLAA